MSTSPTVSPAAPFHPLPSFPPETLLRGNAYYTKLLTGWIPTEKRVKHDIFIDAALARVMLDRNTHNRKINEERLRAMTNKLNHGQGIYTGDPIRFCVSGWLIDGQHRLSAIANSGVSMEALVIFGLPDETQKVIDTGLKRSLAVQESLNENKIGEFGATPSKMTGTKRMLLEVLTNSHARVHDLNELQHDFTDRFGDFQPALDWVAKNVKANRLYGTDSVKAALVLAYKTAPMKVRDFAIALQKGESLRSGDPAYAAREVCEHIFGSDNKNRRDFALRMLRCLHAQVNDEKIYMVKSRKGDVNFFSKAWGITPDNDD